MAGKHNCQHAGCRACGHNRQTGTVTQVYKAVDQGIDSDSRFVAVCADHGSIIEANNLKDAHYLRAHPLDWCDGCREKFEGPADFLDT